jgi:hypothetical protein
MFIQCAASTAALEVVLIETKVVPFSQLDPQMPE